MYKVGYINIMDQYFPDAKVVEKPDKYRDINRRVTGLEYRQARQAAKQAGLHRMDERWRSYAF